MAWRWSGLDLDWFNGVEVISCLVLGPLVALVGTPAGFLVRLKRLDEFLLAQAPANNGPESCFHGLVWSWYGQA
jgi:hypothetical protein